MEYLEVGVGTVLCRQGDAADRFFVIVSGSCDVTRQIGPPGRSECVKVAALPELAVFGESSLIVVGGQPAIRNSTVTSTSGVLKLLALSRGGFSKLETSGGLSPACVAALHAVREKREEENRQNERGGSGGGAQLLCTI